jgi:hypothetical protein
VVSPEDSRPLLEARLKLAEDQIKTLQGAFLALRGELTDLRKALEALEARFSKSADRYVITCTACSTRFDLLAHHYSIGLFDNMVYVKCPKCNKSYPIQGGSGGGVRAVTEENP